MDVCLFFFFKQKTAYESRISDWSSDVCSSDLYKAILRVLAKLSGTHRAGRLAPDFDRKFPYDRERSSAVFALSIPEDKVVQRATRMFDFIARYPKLFPDHVRSAAFREQFMRDIPDVVAASGRIRAVLYGNPDFIAFAPWNPNLHHHTEDPP